MLNFILGCAGTGKTNLLLERLRAATESGRKVILLVPEQFSFEAELAVQQAVGPKLALGVEVLSFTRLCNAVFRALGGLSGIPVTQTGRYLLMSMAVSELGDRLRVYQKNRYSPAFLETLVGVCAEFKTAGISPRQLEEVASTCDPGPLRDKLADLYSLYGAFQALLEQGYSDPDDGLIRACALLRESDLFSGAHIFVDGFTAFMAGEAQLLSLLISRSEEITFAVTADSIHDNQEGMGIFSPAKETIGKLILYARSCGLPVGSPTILSEPLRYKNSELTYTSRAFFLPESQPFPDKPENIFFDMAEDPYREIERVAASIAGLVRENGYRYRDIAVVARETDPYLRSVESVFLREGVPFFADSRRDVENMPLAVGLLSAMEAVRSNLDGEAVLAYAKNPLTGFDPDEIAALEDYCYVWSIRGKLWEERWQNNPKGLAGPLTQADHAQLESLNALRQAVISPLLTLRDEMKNCDGKGFAEAVYAFLQSIDAPGNLTAFAKSLPQGERETFLDESAQLWDCIMEILDVFGAALGSTTLPASRFIELLRLSLASAEIALRPQTLDEVLVGKADRIRPGQVKAVFVIGAVEGQFPPDPAASGVFTDNERRKMIELGAQIGAPSLSRAVLERFYCYHALTLASERLFVSYPLSKMNGAQHRPSWLISRLLELFPKLEARQPGPFDEVYSTGAACNMLAEIYRQDNPQTSALLSLLDGKAAISKLERAAFKSERKIADPDLAKQLFGSRMVLSPSRVERYHRCAFSFFAKDGLGLRRRERVEFTPLESGSVAHHVLQVMVRRHDKVLFDLPTNQMKREIGEIIDGYLKERVNQIDALPSRFRYLFERLSTALVQLLRRLGEEFNQSLYVPTAFELPIRQRPGEQQVKPLELLTAEGVRVVVEGVVDRVDVMQRGETRYLRVVDYKSGGKDFRLDDVICGLNLQMLLYLFTIAENGQGELGGCIPAGVLYMPAQGKYIGAERGEQEDEIAKERQKQWKMSGILLEDEDSLRGMERDLKGVFIPAKMGKDGLDKRSALASKAEMGRLSRKIRELISEMADCLTLGSIPARPLRSGDFDPCGYCELGALCAFEPGDDFKTVTRLDREKVLALLMDGEGDVKDA